MRFVTGLVLYHGPAFNSFKWKCAKQGWTSSNKRLLCFLRFSSLYYWLCCFVVSINDMRYREKPQLNWALSS